jgi:hypothetical protein
MKMRRILAFEICLFITIGSCALCGCATNAHTGDHDISASIEAERQWDDLTTTQKIGYSLWWPFQMGLLAGGSALTGHGP